MLSVVIQSFFCNILAIAKDVPFCIVVIVLTRYLLKKSFAPPGRILQSQKDFVATASHELKSPLAVMISNTDMLLDDVSLNEQAKQAVQTIDFECMRLSHLVKDMLLLASSDAKTWTLHKSIINIDTLLITLYETYEPVCMKQNLELKLHLSCHAYRQRPIISNLVCLSG